jgi:hypothetical protein
MFFCNQNNIFLLEKDNYITQKCAREINYKNRLVAIDLFIEKVKNKNKLFMNLFCNPNLQDTLFSTRNIEIASDLVKDYNTFITELLFIYVKEKQTMKSFKEQSTRISQINLPIYIERLQNIFMESLVVAVYATHTLRLSFNGQIAGLDTICFKSINDFLNTKKINKNYNNDIKSAQDQVFRYNQLLCLLLLRKVNLKSLRKNYKSNSIKQF